MPPPSVIPPMPTEPVSPKPIARPCSPTAWSTTSAAVRPVSAQAVRVAGSIVSALHVAQVDTTPPSVVLWPALSWPPLRTTSSRPVSRAKRDHAGHVRASATRAISPGAVDAAVEDDAVGLVVGVAGRDQPAVEAGRESGSRAGAGRCGRHGGSPLGGVDVGMRQ